MIFQWQCLAFWEMFRESSKKRRKTIKLEFVGKSHTKGLAVLLALGLVASSVPSIGVARKVKKPKLSKTKVSVEEGGTKKVIVKNAKKVIWKVSKKDKKFINRV